MSALFWVGGTGSYDGTTNHFATTTGGTASVAAVTSADTVTFDSNSGTGTVTIAANWSSGSVTMNQTGLTLTTNGTATFTVAAASTLTLTNGTIDTNGATCSWGLLAWGVGTKTLTLGASGVIITGTAGTVWASSTTNTTFNANTSSITVSGNGVTFGANALTFNNVSFTGTGSITVSGAGSTFNNLTRTVAAGNNSALVLQGNTTVNGVFTVTGSYSGATAGRIVVAPSVLTNAGTARTITVNGSVSLTNVDFNYIAAAGSATQPWTGTSIGDGGGNSNITFDSPRTLFMIGASTAANWATLARWSLSSGGTTASTAPLPQDDCKIDANSGVSASCVLTTSLRYIGRNIDFTGVTNAGTLTFNNGSFNPGLTGSLTWASGMSVTGTAVTMNFIFDTRSVTLTNNGVVYPSGVNFRGGGTGSITLADNLNINAANGWTLDSGTFDANNKDVTMGNWSSSNTNTRTLNMGSGLWTISGTSGTPWSMGSTTGLTLNCQTSTLVFSDTGASSKTMSGPGLTYNNVQVAGGGAGAFIFNNTMTIANLSLLAPKSVQFLAAGTMTITGNFNAQGSSGNLVTITSTASGTQAIITKSSGSVASDYLSLTDAKAQGGATWYAGANSTNVSNNTGWTFSASPIFGANLTSSGSGTDASSYATASITPGTNNLILATVVSRTGTSTNPNQPTATGNGLTWTVVNSVVFDDTSSSRRRVTVLQAYGTPSTGAVTFDFAAQTQTSADWSIDQFAGAASVPQNITALDDTGTGTSLSATLGSFSSGSATFMALGYGNPTQTVITPGFTTIANNSADAEAGSQVTTAWRVDTTTTPNVRYGAGGEIGLVAMELSLPSGTAPNFLLFF